MLNQLTRYGASRRYLEEAALYPGWSLGRVTSQYKDLYKIITEEGECLAEISGKFRYRLKELAEYPAVGDFVMADLGGGSDAGAGTGSGSNIGGGNAIIQQVLSRKSVFERAAAGTGQQKQVVAANIDIVFICMALNNDYNLSRLERYLAVAWNSGATPVVVLTKADLCETLSDITSEVSQVAAGADVIVTSGYDQASCHKLLPYLQPGLTASFIGSSGVGKSTLINELAGEKLLATGAIGWEDKGRHTTTRRELLVLPQGGIVIDTPGMRELGVEAVDLSRSFADIDELISQCRFRDCSHTEEPGCAVRQALESGELDSRRLESYRKLKKEAKYDGLSSRQIEAEKINTMFGGMAEMKKMKEFSRKKNKGR
ncbi:MAG: ribosome small subunit-dependent GTPase A [Clostridiales bacterium]